MKYRIYNLIICFIITMLILPGCIVEEADDVLDRGVMSVNIDKPGTTPFIFDPEMDSEVEFTVDVTGEGEWSEVRVYKQFFAGDEESEKFLFGTFTEAPFTITQTEDQLFADVPINGIVLDENMAAPGDQWEYTYEIVTPRGVLTPSYSQVVPYTCPSEIPTEGTWTVTIIEGAFGVTATKSGVTISRTSSTTYEISDITAGVLPALGCCDEEEGAVISDVCNNITIASVLTSASFNYETNAAEGYGPGSYDSNTETLTLPWWEPANGFGATVVFTRD